LAARIRLARAAGTAKDSQGSGRNIRVGMRTGQDAERLIGMRKDCAGQRRLDDLLNIRHRTHFHQLVMNKTPGE
jgi:hypothetical protein